jgi:hypothetical protein
MSKSENLFSRWSRLKHEANVEQRAEPVEPAQTSDIPDTNEGDEGTAHEPVDADNPSTAPVFDPASLPPIDSITAFSDIRPFLQAGVPAELTQGALRSAWAADPAIRDFIGIAENQWDFNDPDGIPGFSAVKLTDYAQGLAFLNFRNLGDADEAAPTISGNDEQSLSAVSAATPDESTDKIDQVAAAPAEVFQEAVPPARVAEETAIDSGEPMEAPLENRPRQSTRLHGSALPK